MALDLALVTHDLAQTIISSKLEGNTDKKTVKSVGRPSAVTLVTPSRVT